MIASSPFEFYKRLSKDYLSYEYYFYCWVKIPEHTTAWQVAKKLTEDYKVSRHSQVRQRRKEKGLAVCNFVIYKDIAVIVATEGDHETLKRRQFKDIRKKPLVLKEYELRPIAYKKGKRLKISVFLSEWRYRQVKNYLEKIALHDERKVKNYIKKSFPYTFEGMQNQKFKLVKMVNEKRKRAGAGKSKGKGVKQIQWEDTKPNWSKKKQS